MTTTESSSNNGDSVVGSTANTSSAAPAIWPSRTASASAASSTIPPRAVLTMRSVGFACVSSSAEISPIVSGVFGRWMVRKSARSTSSSTVGTRSTPSWRARSGLTKGSYATSRIPNALARCATSTPTRPRPTMPSVLSWSSTPSQRCGSTARRGGRGRPGGRCAPGRGAARSCARRPTARSTAARSPPSRRGGSAASTSTLSRPMPARPTTTSSSPASSTSAVTWVALRMTSAAAPLTASSSSSGDSPRRTSTSRPAPRMASSPLSASCSLTSTRFIGSRLDAAAGGARNDSEPTAEVRSRPEELGDALHALDQVVVAQRERQPGVAGRAERLAGHDRDLRVVEQQLAELERGAGPARRSRDRAPPRTTGSSRTRPAARGT